MVISAEILSGDRLKYFTQNEMLFIAGVMPLMIKIEKGEEYFIAYNEEFNVSGTGINKEESVKDL